MISPLNYDVLVVGGGFSGMCAALFAAKAGRRVLIIARGAGALAIGGGVVDVLGTARDGTSLASPFTGLSELPPRHPYQLVGTETLHRALGAFQQMTRNAGFPFLPREDKNTLLITALGTCKPSFLVSPSQTMRGFDTAKTVCILGITGLKDFSPKLVLEGLSKQTICAGKTLLPVSVPSPFKLQRDLSVLDIARYLDTPEGIDWLVQSLKNLQLDPRTAFVLLPPILGTQPSTTTFDAVAVGSGLAVSEMTTLAPAVTGLRLDTLLRQRLRAAGVDLIEQTSVISAECADGRCIALNTAFNGRSRRYTASSYIIATGGILAEGFLTTPDRAWEPIFDLSLPLNPTHPDWAGAKLFPAAPGTHGFALLGPNVDQELRPVDAEGTPLYTNVRFVGRSLGGYDHATEKSGNGVALATAFRAAELSA